MILHPDLRPPQCRVQALRQPDRRALLLAFTAGLLQSGCGGGGSADPAADAAELSTTDAPLPQAPLPRVTVDQPDRARALAVAGSRLNGSALADRALRPDWVYYTDPTGHRWFISQIDVFKQHEPIYSLGPLLGNDATWWPVAVDAMRGDATTRRLNAKPGLSRDTATTFVEVASGKKMTDKRIVDDRRLIEGSSVPVKWYFILAHDGAWYIVADPAHANSAQAVALQFAAANGEYDWRPVNLDGQLLVMDWQDMRPVLRMQPVAGWAQLVQGQSIDMDGWYGAQCVDLMHHYLDSALGITYPHGFTGNAYPIFQEAANTMVKTSRRLGQVTFTKHHYRPGDKPRPGDIVFWSAPDPGHVAIVLSADSQTLTTVDQNWVNSSANGSPATQVVHPHYNHVAGWLRPTW